MKKKTASALVKALRAALKEGNEQSVLNAQNGRVASELYSINCEIESLIRRAAAISHEQGN